MKIENIVEKLNIFSSIFLENKLIKEAVNFVENQNDQECDDFKWISKKGSLRLSEQNLVLCKVEWGGMLGNRRIQDLKRFYNLVQFFDLIYGTEFNFEDPIFFLNERFVEKCRIEKFQKLQKLIRVKQSEEIAVFLGQYPDLLSLFWAIKSKDIIVLEQIESLSTVKLLGKAVPDYYNKICQDIKNGLFVDSTVMISYILQHAMLSRYFPQTGRIEWWSNEYNEANALRKNESSQQKQSLILEAKVNCLKNLKACFLENSEVIQLQREIFPHCTQSMYVQSMQELFKGELD